MLFTSMAQHALAQVKHPLRAKIALVRIFVETVNGVHQLQPNRLQLLSVAGVDLVHVECSLRRLAVDARIERHRLHNTRIHRLVGRLVEHVPSDVVLASLYAIEQW